MSAVRKPGYAWLCLLGLLTLPAALPAAAAPARPAHLPRYDLDVELDVERHVAHVRMVATWINPTAQPTDRVVFNVHSRYVVPGDQTGFMAKMIEILRVNPSEAL